MKILVMTMLAATVALSACASKQIEGISLNRSIPERMTDIGIERQALSGLDNIQGLSEGNHRIAINAFRGNVLLTGETPNEQTRQAVGSMTQSIAEAKQVHNRLKVAEPKSQSHTVHENYLKTKLTGKLITSGIKPSQYSLVVRDDVAYVMGVLTYTQLQEIKRLAQETEGILGFVPLADVLATQEQINNDNTATSNQAASTTSTSTPSGNYTDSGYPNSIYPNSATNSPNTTNSSYIRLYQGKNAP